MADKHEVYFCGKCNQQLQPTSSNARCPSCGKQTVSWHTDRESSSDAMRKWKHING